MDRLFVLAALTFGLGASSALAADAPVGDVYVEVTGGGGGSIYIDNALTGIVAPGIVHAVPAGPHVVRVDNACQTATFDLTVRPNAIERVALTLAPGTGTVSFVTTPDALVTEGERTLGSGSFGPLVMNCGTHTLVATATGRQTVPYTFDVPLRGHLDVKLELAPAALGGIAITPTPLDATVFVDGAPHGTGPMTVDGLPAGVHTVAAERDGYLRKEEPVTVVPLQIVRASLELAPKPPPVSAAVRMGMNRVDWARVGLDTGVTLASAGLGVVAWLQYSEAEANYLTYSGLTFADDPDAYYRDSVQSPRTRGYVLAGVAGLGVVGSGLLWATTHPRPAAAPTAAVPPVQVAVVPNPTGVTVEGRF